MLDKLSVAFLIRLSICLITVTEWIVKNCSTCLYSTLCFVGKASIQQPRFIIFCLNMAQIKDLQLWSLTIQRTRNYCDISDKNTI